MRKQGWSIAAIARHTGRDRKTVRAYLSGQRDVGVRALVVEDAFDRIEPYVRQRLSDDHVGQIAQTERLLTLPASRRAR